MWTPEPALATAVLTLSLSSSLQICLGDVMTNRVVDEVEVASPHPASQQYPLGGGFQGHPFQCMALAGHFSPV